MRGMTIGIGAFAMMAVSADSAHAGTLWIANMSGANENPPNSSPFRGVGFLVLNDAETGASVTATHDIPANQLTGGHIHRGAPGVNGPIILPFANPASPMGPLPWAIPTADVGNLKAGALYMNFHTATFPGGVIRGQFGRVEFTSSAASDAQRAVAAVLDVSAGASAALDQVLFGLATAPAAARAAALEDLGGSTLYAQGREAVESMHGFQETLFQHVDTELPDAAGVGLFAAAGTEWGRRDTRPGQAGSKVTRPSALVGVQYAWPSGQTVGVAVAYADGKDKFRNGRGKTEAETTSIQAFFTTGEQIRLTAIAGYGRTEFDTERNLASLARSAGSSHDANVWALAARLSAPMSAGANLTLAPYLQLDAQRAGIDAYVETGAGAVGLVVPKHRYENIAAEVGAAVSVPVAPDWNLWARAGWRYLLDDGSDALAVALAGSPVPFETRIASPGRSAAHLDFSVTGTLGPRLSASAGYRGLINGREDIHAVQVRLSLAL